MSLDTGEERQAKERAYIVKLWASFLLFVFCGLIDAARFVPGFEAANLHFLYIHGFLIILGAGFYVPVWAYVLAVALFDLIYGLGAFNIPVIALCGLALLALRQKNLSWRFGYSWCVFSLFVVAAECVRFTLMVLAQDWDIGFYPFLQRAALNITLFPLAYMMLKSLLTRG